jgi:hypothetical protein
MQKTSRKSHSVSIILEGCRGVQKAKRHDKSCKQAQQSAEGCLPLVATLDSDKVEGILEIDNRKNLATLSPVKEVVNKM